jgi:hypothetical protein
MFMIEPEKTNLGFAMRKDRYGVSGYISHPAQVNPDPNYPLDDSCKAKVRARQSATPPMVRPDLR